MAKILSKVLDLPELQTSMMATLIHCMDNLERFYLTFLKTVL